MDSMEEDERIEFEKSIVEYTEETDRNDVPDDQMLKILNRVNARRKSLAANSPMPPFVTPRRPARMVRYVVIHGLLRRLNKA